MKKSSIVNNMLLTVIGLCVMSACTVRNNDPETDAHEVGMLNPSKSGIQTGDANATTLVKRGMVIAQQPERKLKGEQGKQSVIYRFHPFDNETQRLRLTRASNNDGKGVAEDMEIDLSPFASKMIEVQGSSYTNRWVFNAQINGIVVPDGDTARALQGIPNLKFNQSDSAAARRISTQPATGTVGSEQ